MRLRVASVRLRDLLLLALQLLWLCWCGDTTSGAESQGDGLTLPRQGREGLARGTEILARNGIHPGGNKCCEMEPQRGLVPLLGPGACLGGVALLFPTTSLLPGKCGLCRQGEEQVGAIMGAVTGAGSRPWAGGDTWSFFLLRENSYWVFL